MITFASIQRCWNRFFFEPASPLPVAVYRAVFGAVVLANQAMLAPDLMVWFGQRGVVSPETALRLPGGTGFNLLRWLPQSDASVWLVFALSLVFAFTLMIGLFTRASAAGLFVMLITLNHRDTLILMSGDSFMRIAAFFLIFSPAGHAFSIDRWRQNKPGGRPPAPLAAPWAMRMIQLQLSALYLYAFVWKAMGTMWLNGTALYYTARLPEFFRFPVPYALEHMWTIRLSSGGTLVVELALGTLVWIKELRYPVLIAGALLHAGIEYSMNIPLFGLVMVSAYLTFVEARDFERFFAWAEAKWRRGPTSSPQP